ncbi:MAG TPA: TlpA disulfide reductase family protein [Bryobacteraceae bacterium]|jgi:thiol-disulfide isomerase/thioredoxin|nr:TlpA disulfide reductase family protein [Bryobacteraceae bacterium]
MKRFLTAVLGLSAVLSTGLLEAQPLSGRRAPSFSLPDSKLKQHDILDYRGKWLVIDFMSTTCPHCKEVTKKLEQFKSMHPGVAILSIVLPPENMATVGRYLVEMKMTTPILFDGSQVAQSYFPYLSPQRPSLDMPHVFAINPQGNIVKDWPPSGAEAPGFVAELAQLVGGGGTTDKQKK